MVLTVTLGVSAALILARSPHARHSSGVSLGLSSSSEVVGGVTKSDFATAEAALGNSILRPSSCAANDDSVDEIVINAKTQEVYVRYNSVTDANCVGYQGGGVVLREWPNDGPSDPSSIKNAMARRAVAMGGSASLTTVGGVPAIVLKGDYGGDCDRSPAPGQEGCAPKQDNPAAVIMQIGSTMIEVMGAGTWSDSQIEGVAETITGQQGSPGPTP
jgi:hypothetical protein